jgi:hypothetical protein
VVAEATQLKSDNASLKSQLDAANANAKTPEEAAAQQKIVDLAATLSPEPPAPAPVTEAPATPA